MKISVMTGDIGNNKTKRTITGSPWIAKVLSTKQFVGFPAWGDMTKPHRKFSFIKQAAKQIGKIRLTENS